MKITTQPAGEHQLLAVDGKIVRHRGEYVGVSPLMANLFRLTEEGRQIKEIDNSGLGEQTGFVVAVSIDLGSENLNYSLRLSDGNRVWNVTFPLLGELAIVPRLDGSRFIGGTQWGDYICLDYRPEEEPAPPPKKVRSLWKFWTWF